MDDTPDTRGPLAREIDSMAYHYLLKTGKEATHILLPRRAPSLIKEFCQALCAEVPEVGTPQYAFDCFWRQERSAQFQGLEIKVYDGSDLIVGGEMYLH